MPTVSFLPSRPTPIRRGRKATVLSCMRQVVMNFVARACGEERAGRRDPELAGQLVGMSVVIVIVMSATSFDLFFR